MDPVNSFGEVLEWTGIDPRTTALGLRVRGLYRRPDRGLVVALIPAHNEEHQIENAIRSLREQQAPPDLIVVCADNCTDDTAAKAEALGAFVLETVANADKKAGALNQALDILLPRARGRRRGARHGCRFGSPRFSSARPAPGTRRERDSAPSRGSDARPWPSRAATISRRLTRSSLSSLSHLASLQGGAVQGLAATG